MKYWKGLMALILGLIGVSSILAEENKDHRELKKKKHHHQKRVRVVGNDGRGWKGWRNPFPLKLCQGDCDTDDDCRGDLVCFQRGPNQPVPGCSGGNRLRMPADICVKPRYGGSGSGGDSGGGSGGGSGGSGGGSGGSGGGSGGSNGDSGGGGDGGGKSFALKLYWQPGYFWQDERIERKWCMRCRNGCRVNNDVAIFPCDENPTRWTFVKHGPDEVQIKVAGQSNLCMEAVFFPLHVRRRPTIDLKRCDPNNSNQRFVPTLGGFDEDRFEITPKNKPGWCLTQRHHPKNNERVEIERCEPARKKNDQTSMWNRY